MSPMAIFLISGVVCSGSDTRVHVNFGWVYTYYNRSVIYSPK